MASDPVRFFVPPHVGHKGWVDTYLDKSIDWDQLANLVEQSYLRPEHG